MKSIILLLCLINFASCAIVSDLLYKHKSEAEIARMTPGQHVDEWVKEQVHHRYDVLDEQRDVIRKYIIIDGLKTLPRIIEYLDDYDPTRFRESKTGEQFDAAWMLLSDIDNNVVRLRASEEGRRAIDAVERSVERMRTAGYAVKKDGYDWNHGKLEITEIDLKRAKGINNKDGDIKDTFRFLYKINMSDAELLEFSNYLIAHYSEYPSWSGGKSVEDNTEISPAGLPVINIMLEKPERYYETYQEFKKTK